MNLVRGFLSALLPVFALTLRADIAQQDAKFAKLPPTVSVSAAGAMEGMARALAKTNPLGFAEWKEIPDGPDNRKADILRIATKKQPDKPWLMQTTARINEPVKKDDMLLAVFWARGEFMPADQAQCIFVFEEIKEPYRKSVAYRVEAEKEWTKYYVPFTATQDYAPGTAQISFQAGFGPQVIQLAGLRVLNYGRTGTKVKYGDLPYTPLTYRGRAANAEWRKEAEERIEKYRKSTITLRIHNSKGKSVSGAEVRIRQIRHAYGFGSAVDAANLVGEGPDSEKYRSIVESSFNKVTLENDLKWEQWTSRKAPEYDPLAWLRRRDVLLRGNTPLVPEWDQWEKKPQVPALEAIEWLRDRSITLRGHTLLWPGWKNLPKDLEPLAAEPAKLRAKILDHIRDIVGTLKGQATEWDVVNEPYSNTDVQKVLGDTIFVDAFKAARDADPKARLFVNDYGILSHGASDTDHQDGYFKVIQSLRAAGAPIGGIGMQGHFDDQLTPPPKVWEVLDRFAGFGIPIQITEHDINIWDEEAWADYTRDFMTACFAHPATNAFITWGFWEGRHWIPNAAYWTKDWEPRPAAKVWYDLVFKKWWTNVRTWTDYRGRVKSKCFLGDYIIEVKYGNMKAEKAFTVKRGGEYLEIELKAPPKDPAPAAVPAKTAKPAKK